MKLYVGSRDYKPHGYLTVDIDASRNPDIIEDITDMKSIGDSSVDEIVAGHVLEHIDWPDSFKAFAEFARVLKIDGILKIAVPDMSAMSRMVMSGDNSFHAMGLIYGIGGRENPFERHRYGFTMSMLIDILQTLGFSGFDWWNSDFSDASNGWVPRAEAAHAGISLNISAVKTAEAEVNTAALAEALYRQPMSDFITVASEHLGAAGANTASSVGVYQRVHFNLIEARQRIKYLEDMIQAKK